MLGEWWRRFGKLFRRDRATAELEDEMRLHLELRARALQHSGMSAPDAIAAARRRFGNRTLRQQDSRDAWGLGIVDEIGQDLRYALRRLRQRPGFTLAVVAVLALGIGATTAMFSAVDAAMLRPLPFPEPEKLLALRNVYFPYDMTYVIGRRAAPSGIRSHPVTVPEVMGMRDVFVHAGAYAAGALNLGDAARPQHVRIGLVTPELFATLGVTPLLGRVFTVEEGAPAGPAVAILSYGLWQREYGGRDMLDRVIPLGGQSYTVVGIMRPDFSFPERSEVWIPLVLPTTPDVSVPLGGNRPSQVVARIAPGLTAVMAEQRLLLRWAQDLKPPGAAADQNDDDDLQDVRAHGVAEPFKYELLGDRRGALLILLGATTMLLLIACSNAASLLLSQIPVRRRELAVRGVLGATRRRLIRQLLLESLALSLAGAALGTALAVTLFGLIRALLPPTLEGIATANLDPAVLAGALILALLVGVFVGVWPAVRATDVSPAETIKSGGYTGTRRGAAGVRRVLVGAEVMLTVVLLIGAGLLLHSFVGLLRTDRGIETAHVGSMQIALPVGQTPRGIWDTLTGMTHLGDIWGLQRQRPKLAAIEAALIAAPGITDAALVDDVPLNGNDATRFLVDILPTGAPPAPVGVRHLVHQETISRGYFGVMNIPVIAGRTFTLADDSGAPGVAVISAIAAARAWPGANAVGRTIRLGPPSAAPVTVVGVVGDVSEQGLGRDTFPQVYLPMAQRTSVSPLFAVVARGVLPPAALLAAMRHAVSVVDPSQAVHDLRMMDDVLRSTVAPRRTNMELITLFALLALALSVFGTYAVVASSVSHRAREFGIRAALGATGSDVVRLVLREMAGVVLFGVAAGLAVAWAVSRIVVAMIYGVSVHDPLTFAVVPVVLVIAAGIATLIPARRAMRVNPAEVMRAE